MSEQSGFTILECNKHFFYGASMFGAQAPQSQMYAMF